MFVKSDSTTEGNWIGKYGSLGNDVIGGAASLPSYATITPSSKSNWTWAASTSDPRALQKPGGIGRIAAGWYSSTTFKVDVNLTDGQVHDLELYFVDWDGTSRNEQVQISNEATGTVLDTETVASFHTGVYLQWAVSGNVLITIKRTGGVNAVLSGLFLDPVIVGSQAMAVVSGPRQPASAQAAGIGGDGGLAFAEIGTLDLSGDDTQPHRLEGFISARRQCGLGCPEDQEIDTDRYR